MKKFILFLWVVLALGTVDAQAQRQRGAQLKVKHPAHNFGDVSRKGGDLIQEFSFVNTGDAPLVLKRVITSCSCLKADFSKQPVLPGKSSEITITYEPHKSEPGVFNKVIRILSNSTSGEEVISVQGNSVDSVRNRGLRRLLRKGTKPIDDREEGKELE